MASKHVQRIPLLDNHLSLLWIKYSLKFLVPCPKTPAAIFTSVLVLILRTSLIVNVRTSSLINSVHQIIYRVVWLWYGRQWLTWILNCLFFTFVHYVRLVCSFISLYFLLPHVWWNKVVYSTKTIIVPRQMIRSGYIGRWCVGCYSDEGTGRGRSPCTQAPPRCIKCNSPPINGQCTNHGCSGPLLCGFIYNFIHHQW